MHNASRKEKHRNICIQLKTPWEERGREKNKRKRKELEEDSESSNRGL